MRNSEDFFESKGKWFSLDPRLINITGDRLFFSEPPQEGRRGLSLTSGNEGKILTNGYSGLTSGQVKYYVDSDINNPFIKPVFMRTCNDCAPREFIDPMSVSKPQYYLLPAPNGKMWKNNLSWIENSTKYREDLISRQLSKHNQNKFMMNNLG